MRHQIIVKVSTHGELDIPIGVLQQVPWANTLIEKKRKLECLIFMVDSHTLRLMDPAEEEILKEKIADAGGFGADLRLSRKWTIHYRKRGVYRLTIPEKQKPWLSLPENNREVCLVHSAGIVEILSMTQARRRGFPRID